MPSFTTWAPFCAVVLPMWTRLSLWTKQSHGCSCQGCKATNHTLWNLPNPASGTYTNTRRNSSEPSGTFRTLPPEPTPTGAGTLQNPPEPSESFRNLPPEPIPFYTGTFRNLPPEPTPAHAGTLRNLPEAASGTYTSTRRNSSEPSGTCSCDPHRHTPELIWAEDPISLRCWWKNINKIIDIGF